MAQQAGGQKGGPEAGAAAVVGAVYQVNGTKLFSVVAPPGVNSDLCIEGIPVSVALLESGALQLTSLTPENDRDQRVREAVQAFKDDLSKAKSDLKKVSADKAKAEAKYAEALSDDEEEDTGGAAVGGGLMQGMENDTDDSGGGAAAALANSVLKLTQQEHSLKRKIRKLEKTKELKVQFTTKGGITATLRPGQVVAVSFLKLPVVWCPIAAAAEEPADDIIDFVMTSTSPFSLVGCTSTFLRDCHMRVLHRMLGGANFTGLRKLTDDVDGNRSASKYDSAVKNHGNVLLLVKANGRVFGGFHVDVFGSGGGWIAGNSQNFLFSMKATDASEATKLLKPPNVHSGNYLHISSCGFHMTDLTAFCSHSANTPSMYNVVAPGFEPLPAGNTIAGSGGNFTPERMEVFEVLTQ